MSKFILLYSSCLLLLVLVQLWDQSQAAPSSSKSKDAKSSGIQGPASLTKELPEVYYEPINYAQVRDTPHHIVKRKSKIGGRGFGFGKKGKSSGNKNRDPYPKQPQAPQQQPAYPKQPAYNPNYPAGGGAGAPPAYPGTNSRPGAGYPAGPPPPYPGTGGGAHHNMPAYPPAYPGTGGGYGGYGQPHYGGAGAGMAAGGLAGGMGGGAFGGKGFNQGGFGGKSGGGLGRTLGSAGFGAVAGTALGAYGGYKLGKMVGGLGRNGHYGYYDDYGKYIRCDPPKNIKVDPETNVTYIPLDQDYDKRCSYYDRRPPSYWGGYTNGGARMLSNPINRLVGGLLMGGVGGGSNWISISGLLSASWWLQALAWDNVLVVALVATLMMFR